MKLEELTKGARVRGLAVEGVATVKSVEFHGSNALEVIFADAKGSLQNRILTREDEPSLEVVESERPWSFDADGSLFRLVSEARRIQLAWLFDPYVAITSSTIEPLPHQISAVYEEMLPRQPMRFLLADDPGAGKTIMAGLLIKELMIRGDLERCLIISPGSLTEQWQDELGEKFGLEFELLTRDMMAASRTSNPFEQKNLLIARLDQLSRNEEIQERLKAAPEWDLVVCDEAHRMSGHVFGDEIKYTQRYVLGQKVGEHTRNLLLMTATPHNGSEEDFQIFLALLDGDRFVGRFREGEHRADPSDLMRRLVKEDLLRFDGSKLFPERKSYTPQYDLSSEEAHLYAEVTEYVRLEMNRAERNLADKEGARKVNVGFALMTLQRRLASSPEAIFRSIQRRRERLEARLREERLVLRGKDESAELHPEPTPKMSEEDWDELYDEATQDEREEVEEKVVDHATAARTVAELAAEIDRLKDLEGLAKSVHQAAPECDAKWLELSRILDDPLMTDEPVARLVVLSPKQPHKKGQKDSAAIAAAKSILESKGTGPRLERNCLLFLAPDLKDSDALLNAVAHYLAWRSIERDTKSLNLDEFQKAQVAGKITEFESTVDLRLQGTYAWGIAPRQSDPAAEIEWEEFKVGGEGSLGERASARFTTEWVLRTKLPGVELRSHLDKYLWTERDHVSVAQLAEWFSRYLYLPRVTGRQVIELAVQDGASVLAVDDTFAVAAAFDEAKKRYSGLKVGEGLPGVIDRTTLVVKPAIARAQRERERNPSSPPGRHDSGTMGKVTMPGAAGGAVVAAPKLPPNVFIGSVKLDGERVVKETGRVVMEVLEHLSVLPGAEVNVTLELRVAVPDGVKEDVVRTVSENAKTLKFQTFSFERE